MPDTTDLVPSQTESQALALTDCTALNTESINLINQIIKEKDLDKTKELTYLFNINQNKKTTIRINKLNELLDLITDQALTRFLTRPDEISNKELLDSLRVVQDNLERSQQQIANVDQTSAPFIQINQQTNEVKVEAADNLDRDSRERVKAAVLNILHGINLQDAAKNQVIEINTDTGDVEDD